MILDIVWILQIKSLMNSNWKAKTSFEDGLMKTIHWYNQNEDIWKDTSSMKFLISTPWKK